jgi:hypothetical protein
MLPQQYRLCLIRLLEHRYDVLPKAISGKWCKVHNSAAPVTFSRYVRNPDLTSTEETT